MKFVRKCRRPLARDTSFLPHAPGRKKSFGTNSHVLNRSLDAIQRRGKGEAANTDSNSDVCQEGLFFEPIEWMREQILFLEGNADNWIIEIDEKKMSTTLVVVQHSSCFSLSTDGHD